MMNRIGQLWTIWISDGREYRDSIKRELTPSQLDRGQVMAREIFERIEKRKAAKGE